MKDSGERWVREIVDDCKNQPPKEWGVYAGISFIIMLMFVIISRGKDEPVFSFSLLITCLILTLASVVIRRQNLSLQWPIVISMLAFTRLIVEVPPFAMIFYAAIPVIVNRARKEIKI
jgi:hypothetical protein